MSEELGLGPYLELLSAFLRRGLNVTEFERRYLDLFKHDELIRPEAIFEILDGMFAEVDSYSPEPVQDEIDEEQLRAAAAQAYARLSAFEEN